MLGKLTTKEIKQIVADYQSVFPEWKTVDGDTLIRTNHFIGQAIWFDRLRTGAYRPSARVHVFAAPDESGGTVVLPQFLGVKNREITARAHSKQFPAVVIAIKSEIVPPVAKALDAAAVAELLSARSAGRPVGAYALACLYAAIGRTDEAKRWIAEYHSAFNALQLPEQPSDRERSTFLAKICSWIEHSSCELELAAVAQREKVKFETSSPRTED